MKRLALILILILILIATPAFAGSFTVTTTAAQDASIAQAAASKGETAVQYVRRVVADAVKADRARLRQERLCVSIDGTRWDGLNAGQKTSLCTICGLAPVDCPD